MSKRSDVESFDIRDGRAMVSLGPISDSKHCIYECPFCYVQSDYESFAKMPVQKITKWLKNQQQNSPFDVVYVSGDTDSFALPRQNEAMDLLADINDELDVDILFTTRAIINDENLKKLELIINKANQRRRKILGCVSIAQYSIPHLEPYPIPSPDSRIEQLRRFKNIGATAILAIRPFLPNVPISDYETILDKSADAADIVLGEYWYADPLGVLEEKVFQGEIPDNLSYKITEMPFDSNDAKWKLIESPQTEEFIKNKCNSLNLPFFMRSRPAIDYIRQQKNL